jgi:chemotaxis methyl-accepting protein methylase
MRKRPAIGGKTSNATARGGNQPPRAVRSPAHHDGLLDAGASDDAFVALERCLERIPVGSWAGMVIVRRTEPNAMSRAREGSRQPAPGDAYRSCFPTRPPLAPAAAGDAQGALGRIVMLLRARTGHDFSLYKKRTLYYRVERRMEQHQIDTVGSYAAFLAGDPQELDILYKEMLIGVTGFFRDPAAWEALKSHVLPALIASRPAGTTLRVWAPGCSTGEEAYSLAIVFQEAFENIAPRKNQAVRIFATDLNRDALQIARRGFYPREIAAAVSPERLRRFFPEEPDGYRVAAELRTPVVFMVHNVIMDRPFAQMDLLICRNLLIYLDPRLQKNLLTMFWQTLNRGGFLFLGPAESVSGARDLFTPAQRPAKLFQRVEISAPARLAPLAPAVQRLPFGAGESAILRLESGGAADRSRAQTTRVIPVAYGREDRLLADITADWAYPELAADVRLAFQNGAPTDREIDLPDGRRWTARITPWNVPGRQLDAVVVAVRETTAMQLMERELRAAETRQRQFPHAAAERGGERPADAREGGRP